MAIRFGAFALTLSLTAPGAFAFAAPQGRPTVPASPMEAFRTEMIRWTNDFELVLRSEHTALQVGTLDTGDQATNEQLDGALLHSIQELQALRATLPGLTEGELSSLHDHLSQVPAFLQLPKTLIDRLAGPAGPGTAGGNQEGTKGGDDTVDCNTYLPGEIGPYDEGYEGLYQCLFAQVALETAYKILPCVDLVSCLVKAVAVGIAEANKLICLAYEKHIDLSNRCLLEKTQWKVCQVASDLGDFYEWSVRMAIEENLARGGPDHTQEVIGTFTLPYAYGGKLELVRDVVYQSLQNQLAAGQVLGLSQQFAELEIADGDTAYGAGLYKKAYTHFRAAYKLISAVSPMQ